MFSIAIDPAVRAKCPGLILNTLHCEAIFSCMNESLWLYIENLRQEICHTLKISDISKLPPVQKAREGYKALGKDPSRYRLSAEALLRRILQGKSLYKVNNMIDILNIISVKSGISIGGYDTDKIQGNEIILSAGSESDQYTAIGRGQLNISGLPVLKDRMGPFGNPTSDSERTCITESTKYFLMVFFDFEGSGIVEKWIHESKEMLTQYASGKDFVVNSFR
jgi:DNA/RNA-binding domain of Phe-tRNA-synthetase-like protein